MKILIVFVLVIKLAEESTNFGNIGILQSQGEGPTVEQGNNIFEYNSFVTRKLPSLNRVRRRSRTGTSTQGNDTNCCGERLPTPERAMTAYKECTGSTELDIRKLGGRCVIFQCMGKYFGVLDDEGYVKEEEYAEAYAELHPPYMKSLVVACVADCIKINEKAKLMVDKWGVKCNPANSMMIDCMKAILEVKCPEDMQIKSPECNKRRQICAKKVQKKGYDPDD